MAEHQQRLQRHRARSAHAAWHACAASWRWRCVGPRRTAQRDDLEAAIAMSDELLEMFAAMLRIAEVEGGDRRAAFATRRSGGAGRRDRDDDATGRRRWRPDADRSVNVAPCRIVGDRATARPDARESDRERAPPYARPARASRSASATTGTTAIADGDRLRPRYSGGSAQAGVAAVRAARRQPPRRQGMASACRWSRRSSGFTAARSHSKMRRPDCASSCAAAAAETTKPGQAAAPASGRPVLRGKPSIRT